MTVSFVRKIDAATRLYDLHIPFADGRIAYYKLSVDPLKEAVLLKACKDGVTADLNSFGTIVESYYMPMVLPALEDCKVSS